MTGEASDQNAGAEDARLRVFLSYSRRDLDFARSLRDRLIHEGFDAYIDVEDIVKGEPWKERLARLIASADAVLFLISPDSIGSDICGWEVNEAERQSKRILPVVARHTPDEDIPGRLTRLNYTFLDTPEKDAAEFAKLLAALRLDAEWVREHTRLAEIAARWEAARRPARLLLRGADIVEAERWRDSHPKSAPEPTSAHLAYITASRRGATRRQRWWVAGSSVVALGAAALAAVALFQREEALFQRSVAQANEAQARVERDGALTTQSRFLADLANQASARADSGAAVALALEALSHAGDPDPRPYTPEAEAALVEGMLGLHEQIVLAVEAAPIRALALAPDDSWVAVLGRTDHQTGRAPIVTDGEIPGFAQLFDTDTGERLLRFDAGFEDQDPLSLAVSPVDGAVALGDRDGRVRLFSPETGALLETLDPGFSAPVVITRFSPDGALILAAAGTEARVFERATGRRVARLDHGVAGITNAVFDRLADADLGGQGIGYWVATTASDGTATHWRLSEGESVSETGVPVEAEGALLIAREASDSGWALDAAFAEQGRGGMVFSSADGALTATEPAFRIPSDHGALTRLAISPDGAMLAGAYADGVVRVWPLDAVDQGDIAQVEAQGLTLAGHIRAATSLVWTQTGRLVTGGDDGTVRIWSPEPALAPRPLGTREDFCVEPGGYALRGEAFAVGCGDGTLRLYDATFGTEFWRSEPLPGVQPELAISADGARGLAVASDGSLARVFDLDARTVLAEIAAEDEGGRLAYGALAPDGARVALVDEAGRLTLWDGETGARVATEPAHEAEIVAIAYSPDGARIATSAKDGTARLWDGETGAPIATLGGHDEVVVWRTAFSPDGALAATVSGSGKVRLWSSANGRLIRDLVGHFSAARHGVFSPDGSLFASAGFDGIRAWNVETGEQVYHALAPRAEAVAFSADGRRLMATAPEARRVMLVDTERWARIGALPLDASLSHLLSAPTGGGVASFAPTAQLWPLPETADALIETALDALPRCLTQEEREAAFLAPVPPAWCAERRLWPEGR